MSAEEMDDFTLRGERVTDEPPEDITGATGFGDFGELGLHSAVILSVPGSEVPGFRVRGSGSPAIS